MSCDRPFRDGAEPIDPTSSAQEESAVRKMVWVLLVIYLAFGGALAALALENGRALLLEVQLTFFGRGPLSVPVGVLLLLCGALGALLLYVAVVLAAWGERGELARLRTRVAELEQAQRAGSTGGTAARPPSSPSLLVPMPGMGRADPLLPWRTRPD